MLRLNIQQNSTLRHSKYKNLKESIETEYFILKSRKESRKGRKYFDFLSALIEQGQYLLRIEILKDEKKINAVHSLFLLFIKKEQQQ